MMISSLIFCIALISLVSVYGNSQTEGSVDTSSLRGHHSRFLRDGGIFCNLLDAALGGTCTCDKKALRSAISFSCEMASSTGTAGPKVEGEFNLNLLRGTSTGSTGVCAGNFTIPQLPALLGNTNTTARGGLDMCVKLDLCGRNSPTSGFCGCTVMLGGSKCTSCSMCVDSNGAKGVSFSCSAQVLGGVLGALGLGNGLGSGLANRPNGLGSGLASRPNGLGNGLTNRLNGFGRTEPPRTCIPLPTLGGFLGNNTVSKNTGGGGILSVLGNRGH